MHTRSAAPRGRRNITGLFQHSEAVDRDWNPGGLWRTGARLRHRAGAHRPAARAVPRRRRDPRPPAPRTPASTATPPDTVRVRTTADGAVVGETEHPLAAGSNEIEWSLDIDRPAAVVAARARRPAADRRSTSRSLVDGEVSDRRSRRTGLREVAWNDWVCSINGERLFLKGANLCRPDPGSPTPRRADVRRDVELAVEAGLDALRVQAHIADRRAVHAPPTSSACCCCRTSRCSGATPARSAARRCARRARPSTRSATTRRSSSGAPTTSRSPTPRRSTATRRGRRLRRFVAPAAADVEQVGPRPLGQAGVRAGRPDPPDGRPRRRRCPTCPQLDGTDSHLWLGWHRGEVGELAERARARAAAGALRQRVRRPVGARQRRRVRRRLARGRTSTGTTCRAPRPRGRRDAGRACRPSEHPTFDVVAHGDAALPGDAAAPPHRDAAPAEVPADGRVLLLVARRPDRR